MLAGITKRRWGAISTRGSSLPATSSRPVTAARSSRSPSARCPTPNNPNAYLYQRKFVAVSQPVRTYDDRRMPFKQISIRPLVTPDIRDPLLAGTPDAPQKEQLFWPVVGNGKFYFTLDCIDWDGQPCPLQAPLLFVAAHCRWISRGRRRPTSATSTSTTPSTSSRPAGSPLRTPPALTPGDSAFESVTCASTARRARQAR